jgi:hypothetical protein
MQEGRGVMQSLRDRVPGVIAAVLLGAFGCFWTYWSFGEFYYEGWGMPFPQPLAYLLPSAVAITLGALTLVWPRVMGGVIIALSVAFYGWAISMNLQRWGFSWALVLTWSGMASLTLVGGGLVIADGVIRARRPPDAGAAAGPWWRRRFRWLVVVGVPLLVAAGMTAVQLPANLMRYDDGNRGARLIDADGVRLVWAPEGPGWNWRQPWGGYPSWDSLAYYGAAPIGLKEIWKRGMPHATSGDMARTGLCGYLSEDGTRLLPDPPHIWRMPTVEDYVKSLPRHGKPAGCRWTGNRGNMPCQVQPGKETPLWAPDSAPIYMWTSEQSTTDAWFVNYLGFVSHQPKGFGNPRHGYRCVKPAQP